MPPVLGPSSPSWARLKSCDGASAIARRPSQIANSETSGPSSSSSITTSPPSACDVAKPSVELVLGVADDDALPRGEAVGLDDARWTGDGERRGRRHAGGVHHVLRKPLRPLDPRRRGTRAEHGDAGVSQDVGDAGHQRRFRSDHDEVGVERPGETEQTFRVARQHGVARAEPRDPRVARRGVHLDPGVTRRASRRERARDHPSRRSGRAPRYPSASTDSRSAPVPTSVTGTWSASSTNET